MIMMTVALQVHLATSPVTAPRAAAAAEVARSATIVAGLDTFHATARPGAAVVSVVATVAVANRATTVANPVT